MNTENVETPVAPKKSKAIEAEFRVKDEANDLVYLKKSLPDAIEVADKIGVTHFQSYSATSRKMADYEKSEIGWSRNGKSFDMPAPEKTEVSEPKPESNKDETKAQGAEIITLDDRTRNLLAQSRKLDSFKAGGSPSEVVRTDFEADSSDGLTPAARRMLAGNRALDAIRAKLALGDRGDAELASESKEQGIDARLRPEQINAQKHVDEKFYVVAGKYHHRATPDKVAFEHDKTALGSERLKTQNATIEVAKDMAAVAKAEGWKSLTVTGNEEFKRQVWLDAQSSGIEVKGYRPTDLDRLLLEEKIKAKEKDPLNNKQYGEVQKVEPAKEKIPGQEQQQNASNVVDFKKKDQSHEGNVVDYGHAPYKFEKDEKPSFYVTLKTTAGTKTIWGKDLENGIKKNNVQKGDNVTLTKLGDMPVTVTAKEKDKMGKDTGREVPVNTHRNEWEVKQHTKRDNLLKGAELVVAATIASPIAQQAAFKAIAERSQQQINNGKGLPDVAVYDAKAKSVEQPSQVQTKSKDSERQRG